ncbi:MAG: alternative ribosome rescue aminoacyl-tRNA hydrolase ArfB [Gammaproteobacteria bacterium]|nr:alternative ribosome rescue aminoacyl-tRNA hydrolase ArfB [Gammaproteobacteria bacterium]MDH3841895.1 alternative ribosome rescue aminoacyl-tRNA hydrolase ArfB [Chromatiales bacterium]
MDELKITENLSIPMSEIVTKAVRAQGAGGQNVNKVATAIHLRFDIANSTSLPDRVRSKLLASGDQRITSDGVLIIKSQESRSQDRNRLAALDRLAELVRSAMQKRKPRVPTKPSKRTKAKRLDAKSRRGELKKTRKNVLGD